MRITGTLLAIATVALGHYVWHLTLASGFLYATAEGATDMTVIDVRDPRAPRVLATVPVTDAAVPGAPALVAIHGTLANVVAGGFGPAGNSSVSWMSNAVDGPLLATVMVYVRSPPATGEASEAVLSGSGSGSGGVARTPPSETASIATSSESPCSANSITRAFCDPCDTT